MTRRNGALHPPMTTDPQPNLGPQQAPPQPPAQPEKRLLAPAWHTLVLVTLMLINSFFTASYMSRAVSHAASGGPRNMRLLQYGLTIAFELFLLFLVWVGLRLKRTKLRDLIGGRWNTPEDFLLDIAIALGFWFASALILAGLGYLLGLTNPSQVNDIKQRLQGIVPQSGLELALWVALSSVAGFVEEIVFRGYLQRQIAAISGNVFLGIIASAVVFGAGHGYEGERRMLLIAVYGIMFGLLAHWRKSLRPGMMAHALQDTIAGVAFRFLSKTGGLPSH